MGRPVSVGRVTRAHGIRGEVVVHRFGEGDGVLEAGSELTGRKGRLEFTLTVESSRPYKQDWIVTFRDVATRNDAEGLAGTSLFLDESELPPLPEGAYYSFQLVGLRVLTEAGDELGRLDEILETAANDVYVVRGGAEEILLPSIPQVVQGVDLEAGVMRVRLLPGLVPSRGDDADREEP